MMLPLQEVLNKYCICPKGVIHVGAHWAEEHEEYVRCGINRFTYIEPCKDAFYVLMKKFGFEYSENEYKHYSRGYGDEKMNINLLNFVLFNLSAASLPFSHHLLSFPLVTYRY